MTRSVMLAVPWLWTIALMGSFVATPAVAKKSRFDARIAIFVTAEVPALERNAAFAKGVLRELAAFIPKYPYLAGKTLRRKLRSEPDAVIVRCEGKTDCIARLGRRLKVAEVMVGVVSMEPNGAVLRLKVVDATKEKVVRKIEVPIPSKDALRPGLKVRAVALFGVKPVGRVVIPGNDAKVMVAGKLIGVGPGPFALPPGALKIVVGGIAHEVEIEAFERTRLDADVDEPPLLGLEPADEPELFIPPLEEVPEAPVKEEPPRNPPHEAVSSRSEEYERSGRSPQHLGTRRSREQREQVAVASLPADSVMNKSIEEIMATMPGDIAIEGPLDAVVAKRGTSVLTWSGIATGGLGVIALGTGAYFGTQRQSAQDDLDSLVRGSGGDTQLEAERIEERGDKAARRATIAFSAGGALVAVGATLVAIDLWPADSRVASVWVDERGASVQLGWTW